MPHRFAILATLSVFLALAVAPIAQARSTQYILEGETVFPEGVAAGVGDDRFYVTSSIDGTVFQGTLGRRRTRVFLAPGRNGRTAALGLKATRDRLIVAGSRSGLVFVYHLPSGRLVRRFSIGAGMANDVALAPNGDAYVTDSQRGLVFRVSARSQRRSSRVTTPLTPMVRLERSPTGTFANGIVSAGRRYLIVAGTISGVLVRVDLRTDEVRRLEVDVADAELIGIDGMARDGRVLYAANPVRERITEFVLSEDWLSARTRRHLTNPAFRQPTTVAIPNRRLLVVNSQFNLRGGTPVLPFTVSDVPRP